MDLEKRPAKNALQLFADFNENNVRYCHWKSNEHLLPGLTGDTDLDVYIDPADAGTAYALMVKNNYKQVISHPWKLYSALEDWIGLDEEQMLQTHLHVHYRLLTGLKNVKDQYFSFGEIVLKNTVMHDTYDIRVCNPNIEVIILFSRIALKKSGSGNVKSVLNKDTEKEYEYLKERTTKEEVEKFANEMFTPSVAGKIVGLYENPKGVKLFKTFRKELLKELRFLQRNTRSKAESLYRRRAFAYKFGKLIKKPVRLKKKTATGGKLISFIGVDGAGKTTLATFFAKWLSWKIDCRYISLGTGDGKSSLLNRIKKKIIGAKSSGKKSESKNLTTDVVQTADAVGNATAPEKQEKFTFKRKIKRTLSNIVYLSNDKYKYKTIRNMYRLVNAGTVVITDRYPQMDFPGIYDGMTIKEIPGDGLLAAYNRKLARKERKLYEEMCRFNPDIIVKLHIPVEVSVQRKPCSGKELENVKRKVEITELLHYKGSKEYVVDSSKDLDETKREVISLLWRQI